MVYITIMKLVMEPVNTTRLNAECECGGNFEPTGQTLDTHPVKYTHVCQDCGKIEMLDHKYPRIVHTTRTSMPLTTDMLGTSMFRDKL